MTWLILFLFFLQAVEVFVCRVKPIDRDTEWTFKVSFDQSVPDVPSNNLSKQCRLCVAIFVLQRSGVTC